MVPNFGFEILVLGLEVGYQVLLLEHFQKVLLVIEPLEGLNILGNLALEALELGKSKVGKILRGRTIVLDALQVADDIFGIGLLLIDDLLQVIKLLVHLLVDLVL